MNWIRNTFVPIFRRLFSWNSGYFGNQVLLDEVHNLTGNIFDFLDQIDESAVVIVFATKLLKLKSQAGKLLLQSLLKHVTEKIASINSADDEPNKFLIFNVPGQTTNSTIAAA